jgi:7-cyano-7-deazaguanine synthase
VGAAVTVYYGQKAGRREVEKARELCDHYGVKHMVLEALWLGEVSGDALTTKEREIPRVDEGQLGERGLMEASARQVWVPNRNGLLANMGACVAEALGLPWVVMGLNAEEAATFPDNSPGFVKRINRAFSRSTLSGVRLRSFTIKWNKVDIFREAMARELDFRFIWSCYNGEELMCGSCEACARLASAARLAGASRRLEGFFEKSET